MTPIERIRQSRDMVELSRDIKRPALTVQAFPRNPLGLALVSFMIMPLIYKAIVAPTPQNILGFGLCSSAMALGLFSLSVGQKREAIYNGKRVARAGVIPFKAIGAAVLGLSAAGLTYYQAGSALQAAAVFPVVTGLTVLAFGLDPLRNKGLETTTERDIYKLEKLAANVGDQMSRLKSAVSPLAVPEVMSEVRAFDDAVNGLLNAVTHDPGRVAALRKYFTVYLDGAASASRRFAAVYTGSGDVEALRDYVELLQKLTAAFSAKTREYAAAGNDMLDIEIKVLDDYLARESAAA